MGAWGFDRRAAARAARRAEKAKRAEAVVALFHQGKSNAAISAAVGVSPRQIVRILHHAGHYRPRGRPKLPIAEDQRRFYHYLCGAIDAKAAREHFGISS